MFNVGDKVRCLNGMIGRKFKQHSVGKIFKVKRVNCVDETIFYIDLLGKEKTCYTEDFELVTEKEIDKLLNSTPVQINTSDIKMNMDEVAKAVSVGVQELNKNIKSNITDHVNHPIHYNKGNIEVIDYIEDKELNFNLGNAVKYISRCNHKGRKKEDLEKAIWYLKREINTKNIEALN